MRTYLDILTESVIVLNAKNIVEIGVQYGNSGRALLKGCDLTHGVVTGVELDEGAVRLDLQDERYSLIFGDSTKIGIDVIRDPIDLLSIDSSHTFDGTLKELLRFEHKMARIGVILLHDINHYAHRDDILNAINQFLHAHCEYSFFGVNTVSHTGNGDINEGIGILTKDSDSERKMRILLKDEPLIDADAGNSVIAHLVA